MNFRRGFFRFWILASIVWLVSFGLGGANDVSDAIAYWTGTANVTISPADGVPFDGVQFGEELIFPVNTPFETVEDSIRQGIANGKVTVRTNMSRLDQIWRALRKANKAGDAASVKIFTVEIARIRDTLLPVTCH